MFEYAVSFFVLCWASLLNICMSKYGEETPKHRIKGYLISTIVVPFLSNQTLCFQKKRFE